MGFRTAVRAAALSLMDGYKASASLKFQTYPARPASIYPQCGFVDAINEGSILFTVGVTQRAPSVDLIFIAGLFDSKDAVEQQDALVDGFVAWVRANYSAAGAGTLLVITSIGDIPGYIPDWIPDAPVYYATRVTIQGLKLEGGL